MLISSFLSCALLLVQSAICSDLNHDSSVIKKTQRQETTEATGTYQYNHPPLPGENEQTRLREDKSINDEQTTTKRPRIRTVRRRARTRTAIPSLEIPVQVIYETVSTTIQPTSDSTNSPVIKTAKVSARKRRVQSNSNRKIDIRQTTTATSNSTVPNLTEIDPISRKKETNYVSSTEFPKRSTGTYSDTNKKINIRQTTAAAGSIVTENVTDDYTDTTKFPKRSRESYFKKRTEGPAPKVKILEEKNFVFSHSGNFHYSFLGGDGTKISSEGTLKSYNNNKTGEAVSGSVFYTDYDGNDYSLSYTADENGYRPVGAHLPTPPPLPPAIARALKYIAEKSTQTPLQE